ncbi:MAG: phage tail protein [Nocardioides sp.]
MGGGKSGKAQTIGYKHHVGMHMVLCHGPIDSVIRLDFHEREGWAGSASGGTITVSANELFGGQKREGGVSGLVDVMMGLPTQTKNSYLLSKIGPSIPAYRGVVSLVFRGAGASSFYWGNNPYLKPVRMRGQRIHIRQNGIPQWYDAKAPIGEAGLTGDQAILIAVDKSGSMAGARITNAKTGINGFLDFLAPYVGQVVVDIQIVGWSAGAPTIMTKRAVTSEGIAQLKAFVSGIAIGGGTDFSNGVNSAPAFFADAPADATRSLLFLTDGEPNSEANTVLAVNTVNSLTGVSVYGFNIDLTNTTQTARLDNTPGDGVPVISGADPDALTSTLSGVFSGGSDLNPSHLIRECLTDPDWGMGYAEEDVDDAKFMAAADKLFNEKMGMSLVWDRQMSLESFISEVVRHIDGALFVSRTSGKFVLKLTRDDYDPAALLLLDESNIEKIDSPSRPAFGELVNSVSVNFWNAATGKQDSVTLHDPAGVQMQGTVINTTMQYPGFTNLRIASMVGSRDLRALSNPFLTCTIYAKDAAKDLEIGDTFRLSWAKWRLSNVVMRVTGFALGDGRTSQVRISCVEDVFSTPMNAVYTPAPEGWVDPASPPLPAAADDAFEVPYYEIVQARGQTETDTALTADPDLGYLGAAAMRGSASAINAELWTDAGAGYASAGTMDLSAGGFLTAALGKKDTAAALTGFVDLDIVKVGTHCQIGTGPDAELCRVDAITTAGALTLGRGVLDTVPQIHAAGRQVLFWDEYGGRDAVEYATGEIIKAKVTPISGAGQVPLSAATERTVAMATRAYRPYPPANLTINGDSYEPDSHYEDELTIAWAHRDRTLQTSGELADHFDGSIGPEAGVTYRLIAYIGGLPVDTVEPVVTPLAYTPTREGLIRIEADTKRDGVYSWQAASHEFFYSRTSARVTQTGDQRLTVDGNLRVAED